MMWNSNSNIQIIVLIFAVFYRNAKQNQCLICDNSLLHNCCSSTWFFTIKKCDSKKNTNIILSLKMIIRDFMFGIIHLWKLCITMHYDICNCRLYFNWIAVEKVFHFFTVFDLSMQLCITLNCTSSHQVNVSKLFFQFNFRINYF